MGSYHDTLEALRDDPPGIQSIAEFNLAFGGHHFTDEARPIMSAIAARLAQHGFAFGEPFVRVSIGLELRDETWAITLIPHSYGSATELRVERRDERLGLDANDRTRALLRHIHDALWETPGVSALRWKRREEPHPK